MKYSTVTDTQSCRKICLVLLIIIAVDRRASDKRSKIDSGRWAQHVLLLFLSLCHAPKDLAPFSYIAPQKNSFDDKL